MDKWFLNPATGKTVKYPEHFAQLKPYLVEVAENPICEDCMIDTAALVDAEPEKNDEDAAESEDEKTK